MPNLRSCTFPNHITDFIRVVFEWVKKMDCHRTARGRVVHDFLKYVVENRWCFDALMITKFGGIRGYYEIGTFLHMLTDNQKYKRYHDKIFSDCGECLFCSGRFEGHPSISE
jgi:hypothetical protein